MIKAILFDYDETLVQTLSSKIPAYISLAKEKYNFNLPEERIRQSMGKPYEEFIYSLYGDVDDVQNIIKTYRSDYSPRFPNKLYSNCLETINQLIKTNKIGILSGYSRDIILSDLERLKFPVKQLFYVQAMEDSTYRKPDPRVFEPLFIVTDELGILKKEILYVGDDVRDFEAADKAGVNYVGMAEHTTTAEVFEKNGAQYIKDFSELTDFVKKFGR